VPSVLITGTSTGIGRAAALALGKDGWRVFAGVRREEDGDSLASEAVGAITPLLIDVTDAGSIEEAARRIEADAGSAGLDGLVNNAGLAVAGPLETLPLDDFRHQLEVNLTGQVAVTQGLLPLIRRARGRIVFISSIGGRISLPFASPYHASKFGIEAVGDSLRQELRPWGIEVILVEPGSIATPIWERGRQRADEMAERAPDAQEKLYGEQIDKFREATREAEERGIAPERVAGVIAKALTARRPRTRYLVGTDAKVQAGLRKVVGDRLLDRLIASQMR
jgi:NAD(P)-dependent dehydrogenase (short-subunit alcohol dehydrogenase family)